MGSARVSAPEGLLLDTHAWIWLNTGDTRRLGKKAARLPGDLHPHPADRMIVSTARHVNAALITRDERLLRYAAAGWIKAVDAAA